MREYEFSPYSVFGHSDLLLSIILLGRLLKYMEDHENDYKGKKTGTY